MKVTIDVPIKYWEITKGMMLGAELSEEMEKYLLEAMSKIKEMDEKGETLHVRMERLKDGEADARQSYTQVMLAIAAMGFGEFKEEDKPTTSSLTARLESLQRQAEELRRKIQEGKI